MSKFKTLKSKFKIGFRRNLHSSLLCGQSLFEVVVAIGLTALILSGVVTMAAATVRNSGFTRNNAQATKYAQELLEWLRGQRDVTDWSTFSGHTGTFYFGSSPPTVWTESSPGTISGTIFSRNAVLTSVSSEIIEAEVTVSWSDSQGTHQVKSKTRLTNWNK